MASTNDPVGSCSVFKELTNGNYLAVGKVYLCPAEAGKTTGTAKNFTSSNNSYACVVATSKGFPGLSKSNSTDNPLILERGLIGAPSFVVHLQDSTWSSNSPHADLSGNVFYIDGRAERKMKLETGADGAKGYVLEP